MAGDPEMVDYLALLNAEQRKEPDEVTKLAVGQKVLFLEKWL